MTTKPVSELPSTVSPVANDVVVIVRGGLFYQTTVDYLRTGMAVATSGGKGLMSAADKVSLDSLKTQMAAILAPQSTTIASAASITIPAGKYHFSLTGTTEVTSVVGLTPRVLYSVDYPSGAGLTFMGTAMQAGETLLFIDV